MCEEGGTPTLKKDQGHKLSEYIAISLGSGGLTVTLSPACQGRQKPNTKDRSVAHGSRPWFCYCVCDFCGLFSRVVPKKEVKPK